MPAMGAPMPAGPAAPNTSYAPMPGAGGSTRVGVTRLPDSVPVQSVGYQGSAKTPPTTAQLAGQRDGESNTPARPVPNHWWEDDGRGSGR